jgi:hypothetical protein
VCRWPTAPHEVDAGAHALLGRAAGVVDRREQLGVRLGGVTVERVEQHLQRAAHRARIGLAGQHQRAGRRPLDELLDEPGLADAGLAGHERDGGGRPGAEQNNQAVELDRPADHHRRQP